MKTSISTISLFRQRITLLLAVLFCLLISSTEYIPQQDGDITKTEHASDNPDQTLIKVAVDAVVPFALHVVHSLFYLIYKIFSFEIKLPTIQVADAAIPFSWVEILFERIISTKGP